MGCGHGDGLHKRHRCDRGRADSIPVADDPGWRVGHHRQPIHDVDALVVRRHWQRAASGGCSNHADPAQGGWRADDVGKWVDLNAGLVQITAVTSPTVATGELRKTMSAVVAVPALAWVLMGDAWVAPTDIRGLAPSTNRGCGRAGHVSSRSPCGVHASVNT
ncbi:hypothetical protein SNK04_014076 [Fusarium graminearum]